MRDPSFWWRPAGIASSLLAPIAIPYGALARSRMAQAGSAAGIPVICIGNPTVGGAGKTPTALAVAKLLRLAGRHPFFLSRGYGGDLPGPVRVDSRIHRARKVGDEALLLARVAPTIVARDRVAGAKAARESGADVIVMDDGFQNPSLRKDLSILVVDGRRGIGNGRVFPAGPLRAPFADQLSCAQAVLVIGDSSGAEAIVSAAKSANLPLFRGRLAPDQKALAALASQKVLAFAGIGNPEKFFATLAEAQIDVQARQAFPDHYRYQPADAAALLDRAEREGLSLVTTEKDAARLVGEPGMDDLAKAASSLPVTLVVEQEKAFADLVVEAAAPN
jgi:tetraacyldisaccharide 4'-kinase